MKIFAEHRGLGDDTLAPKDALVVFPVFAITSETRGHRVDPPVQRLNQRFAEWIIVVSSVLGHRAEGVVETAGHQQAREGAQQAEPAVGVTVGQARCAKPGRRVPADGHAFVFAITDVHGTVDEHREPQARTSAELQHPVAAFDAVVQHHRAHAEKLRRRSGMGCYVAAGEVLTKKLDHGRDPLRRPGSDPILQGSDPKKNGV